MREHASDGGELSYFGVNVAQEKQKYNARSSYLTHTYCTPKGKARKLSQ